MDEVMVTVDESHLDRIDEVVQALRDSGMQVDQVADVVIVGHVEDAERLAEVGGVMSVEPTHRFQLPPPDAEVQ
jgi:hypothetical protein